MVSRRREGVVVSEKERMTSGRRVVDGGAGGQTGHDKQVLHGKRGRSRGRPSMGFFVQVERCRVTRAEG